LTFVVDGDNTSDGKTTTGASLSYTKPTLSGLAGNFSLAGLIQLSGGRPNGDNVSCNLDDTECWTSTVRVNIGKTTGDLSVKAYCDLACGNRKGDLDGDNVTADDEDMYLMRGLLDTQRMIGRPTYDPTPACADVTGDGVITTEDMECLSSNFQNCKNCSARMQQEHAYSASMEICGDGRDNNCDGQTDRETYQNSVGDFYSVSNGIMLDTCDCNWRTPCEMLYDRRGGLGNYSKEDDVKRCAKIETANNMDYNYHSTVYDWYTYSEWKCTSERQGWRLTCNGQSYNCESGSWVKEGALSVNYPPNPLTGGTATPVTKCSVVYNAQLSFFGADDHYAYWSWPSGGIPRSGPDLAFICDGTSIYSCGWEKDATAALPVIVEPVGAVRGMWRCSFYNSTANTRHGYWTRPY
jgi:hypothetical protein